MHRAIALDLTCLALGPMSWTPRGIDRVELAYAWHFLAHWPGDCFAVIPTVWGVRYFDRARAMRGLAALEEIWRETSSLADDAPYQRVKAFLSGEAGAAPSRGLARRKPLWRQSGDFLRLLGATGVVLGKPVTSLPQAATYLNVGQLIIFRSAMSWLKQRPDISSVFMIHDLLPLQLPDYHVALGQKLHRRIVENAARFADALIVPSQAVQASLQHAAVPANLTRLPVHVELLPVPRAFLQPAEKDPGLIAADYFVACGALEAHKNHLLLLEVWSKMVAIHGSRMPKLVIAGNPSVTSQALFDFVARNSAIRDSVFFVSGLSTAALRSLIMSAKALLMPSLGEGFGLPIVEALAQGTAVIASDIAAHREAGAGGEVIYLNPYDPAAWMVVIELYHNHEAQVAPVKYSAKRWEDYFVGIEEFLATQTSSPQGPVYGTR